MPLLSVGDRVKPSAYALRAKLDEVHKYLQGRERDQRQAWYDEAASKRGTVTALNPPTKYHPHVSPEVTWDSGSVSKCMACMVELA